MKKKLIGLILLCLMLSGCQNETVQSCVWVDTEAGKQYIGAEGHPVTGWQEIDGIRFHFSEDGILSTGWVETEGKRYYLSGEGTPLTGWQEIGGEKYYFHADGTLALGQLTLPGEEYLMTEKGVYTGVYETNGTLVLYDESGKRLRQEGMTQYGDRHYYISENGTLHTG